MGPINEKNSEANVVIGLGGFGGSQFIFVCWFCLYFPRGGFPQEASSSILADSAFDVLNSLQLFYSMMECKRLLMMALLNCGLDYPFVHTESGL